MPREDITMAAHLRPYRGDSDVIAVRDFLVTAHRASIQPLTWRLERWNYCRYFVVPMLATYGGPDDEALARQALHDWEGTIGLWEDEGNIVGMALCEDQRMSEAFVLRHPTYGHLLDEMVAYAEDHLRPLEDGALRIPVYDHDLDLQAVLRRRGYVPEEEHPAYDSLFVIQNLPTYVLPDGYALGSMADAAGDIEKRREVFGRAFGHPDPQDWPSRTSYKELQRAPDYRPELDFYIVAPDGTYAACCIVWWDAVNRMGILEPVGTHPEYRRRGLGRAVVCEAIRRVADLGARRCWVGSGQPFYEAIGFRRELMGHTWRAVSPAL
jgi:predicted N-acetyltransferase YhbS